MRKLMKTLILFLFLGSICLMGYSEVIYNAKLEGKIVGGSGTVVTVDSATFANIVATENVVLDIAAGSLVLQDGTVLYFTDGTEADSAYISHDGTDLVITGDGGTGDLKLSGIGLDNDDDNITNVGQIDIDLLDCDGSALTIGDNDETIAINSSDWDISTIGDMSGIGNIALDSTIDQSGTMNNGINMTGTYSDHVIDIQPSASLGDYKAIYIGTWGTEAEMNDGGGLFRIYGKVGAGGTATANIFVRTLTESTSPPISAQFYTDVDAIDSASAPHTMDGIDVFALINDNKYFAEPANDSLDMLQGMRAIWAKVGAGTGSHIYGNVATIWVDNQINCAVTGREYGIFSTTGGSKPDAWAGFETTSSGWSYLFDFDKTAYDKDPVGSGNASGGSKDYYLKVNINGVAYGIQLYAL
jgi:hypothetical protein